MRERCLYEVVCITLCAFHYDHRAKKVLGNCVKIAAGPREEFSRLMLLFSLTNSWIGGEEDTSSSQLMYVHMYLA